jgi:hypothetical protein
MQEVALVKATGAPAGVLRELVADKVMRMNDGRCRIHYRRKYREW